MSNNLNNYFGKYFKKTTKEEMKHKPTKVIACSSDEEPIVIKETKGTKRRSKDVYLTLADDEIIEDVYPEQKKSNKEPKSRLYEKISKVNPTKFVEVDPETFFSSGPIKSTPKPETKKRKRTEVKDSESILSDQEKTPKHTQQPYVETSTQEIKQDNTPKFIKALQREQPRNLGEKPLPIGAKNCLEGLTFVITGILEYFDREDIVSLVQRYGGKCTKSVSGRTSYVVVGREPGETKLKKAQEAGTQLLKEEELYKLISDTNTSAQVSEPKGAPLPVKKKASPKKLPSIKHETVGNDSELWVDKYKPKDVSEIIGQHGPKSSANKLLHWLENWKSSRNKAKKNYFASKEDGSLYRAALLSGQPGIGKTTTAKLVCKKLGYDVVEMNASNTRNKKCLDSILSASLQNIRISKSPNERKSALIMDEVDGMSGNQDRGGIQELIALIKTTKVPIICICNDRNSQKIRSLSNYCYDLRFPKPRVEQVKTYVMEICDREGLTIEQQAAEQIVMTSHNDIRLILNNLQMWSSSKRTFEYDDAKLESKSSEKDTHENIFEVIRKIFSRSASSKMSLNERVELFFVDYSIVPLFVFENYLHSVTADTGNKRLINLAKASQAMSLGVLCENQIKSTNNWSLLPVQAILSTVIPSELMSGGLMGPINFPQWLGKNSSSNKSDRMSQELVFHSQLKLSLYCKSKDFEPLDYLPYMSSFMYSPMLTDDTQGVNNVASRLADYDLTREDWDSIIELCQWSSLKLDPLPTKVKSAFTRTVNKILRQLPYSLSNQPSSKTKISNEDEDENEASDTESQTEAPDRNITVKVSSTPAAPKTAKKRAPRKIKT